MTTVASRTVPFARPWITDAERQAVADVLSGDVLTHGPQGRLFEEEFSRFLGDGAFSVSTSSGMAALHLTYFDLGIRPGDEVIVPAQTHIATAHAVEAVGARPVFVDCDRATGNIGADRIEAALTSRTRAISLVHFAGIPCEMDAIVALADRSGVKVIEDCALAVGARYAGRHVGLFGDAGCFSFYPVKHITTGDGGMFVSRHQQTAARVSRARAFGVDRSFAERTIPGMYDVPTLGLNYRMSDINAAIGRQQLARIDEILARRRHNFERLKAGVSSLEGVSVIDSTNPAAVSSHYCLVVVLADALGAERNALVTRLNAAGVGTSVYYPQPVPRMTYYRQKYGYRDGEFPAAEAISDRSIALPVGPHLSVEDVDYVATTFSNCVKEIRA